MNVVLQDIEDILRAEDVEGLIKLGAPPDEYDSEAAEIAKALSNLDRSQLVEQGIVGIVSLVWAKFFNLGGKEVGRRLGSFESISRQLRTKILQRESR